MAFITKKYISFVNISFRNVMILSTSYEKCMAEVDVAKRTRNGLISVVFIGVKRDRATTYRLQDIRSKNVSIKRHFKTFVGHWHTRTAFSKEVESD